MDNQNDKYFTMWYGVYNQAKRQLVYSSAGHPPAVLLCNSTQPEHQVKRLKTSSLPVGMLPDVRFNNQRCDIENLSMLYVFSDGIYEILQSDGDIWGLDAFIDLLNQEREDIDRHGLDYVLSYIKSINSSKDVLDDDLSLLRISFR